MKQIPYPRGAIVALLALLLAACEKPYVGLQEEEAAPAVNFFVNVTSFEQIPFDDAVTRASAPSEVCSRLNFVIYQGDEKVKSIPQRVTDADFGRIAIALPQGQYKLAVVGHSSVASASISSLDKISFEKSLITDTFSFYDEFEIGEGTQTLDITLRRVVAMFRLQQTADVPEGVTQLKFYYTGGSSTLSAVTGYGSVNSKQTVVLDVAPQQREFEVYTIPHAETGELKMTISALNAAGAIVYERTFENVPVQRNRVTRYVGDIFDGTTPDVPDTPDTPETFEVPSQLQVLAEWDEEHIVTF